MINMLQYRAMFMDQAGPLLFVLLPFILLDLALKAIALWRAARMNMTIWFVLLLLVNSLGILPIIFLLLTNSEYKKTLVAKKIRS